MERAWKYGMAIIALVFLLAGCGGSEAQKAEVKTAKPVAVMELKEEAQPHVLHYTGTIQPREVKEYSFKTAGRIAELLVEEGQTVSIGEKLAALEPEDSRVAELDVEKARSAYDFASDYYNKINKLQQAGAASHQDLQEAALKMEQARYSLEQAQKILELTRAAMVINADIDGYVIKVNSRENEVVAAGYPVVVVGSHEYKARIGLIEEDLAQVKTGDEVSVTIGNKETKGMITAINQSPDQETRTYTADISLDNELKANMGAIIKVTIKAGNEKGIWVPVKYILNDGEDYVLVVEQGRARRRNVTLGSMLEDRVRVEGLKAGERLITEGIKSVKDGYEVSTGDDSSGSVER
ncbi:MAG: efflux RND transporter periplasmic adaptor subunit [Syntrophomonadaceae bacterium]|nr:efflux RND transporter periplasmic adaptor subunit [Syntrophomonadaceae bacterium]